MPTSPVSGHDVVVVGSGPNGLAAAIVAAQRGHSTRLLEAGATLGGGLRSGPLTLPGFVHDLCASVHPMAVASPFFRSLPLERHGLQWITPPAAAAHPLDGGDAVMLWNDLERCIDGLGADGRRYRRTIGALAADWAHLEATILAPVGMPRHPLSFARFGLPALLPARTWARWMLGTPRGRALFAGCAAHSIVPFSYLGSAAIGMVLATVAHTRGWPIARGGSQAIADALAAHFVSLGGTITTDTLIETESQLPRAGRLLFDTSPAAMARIMGPRFPAGFADRLARYPHGPGVFKVDWALSGPIPWRAPHCLEAATVHVGGTLEEIAAAEAAPWRGECPERPFVLVTQPSLFDPSRAPVGQHTAWGYCHVPRGSTVDMTARIEAQLERFAPGFRERILARSVRTPATLAASNPNYVGGDIGGGANTLWNLVFRPTWRRYGTPARGVYLCSAATPPGGGVHGMCGFHAAERALDGPQR